MNARDEIKLARAQLAEALDARLAGDPLWKAFRAMDRALDSLEQSHVPKTQPYVLDTGRTVHLVPTYNVLAKQVILDAGRPVPTSEIMEFIRRHRKLSADPEKAKVNVTSSLSKDKRFKSVPWENGRAWWYGNEPPPKSGAAVDLLVNQPS